MQRMSHRIVDGTSRRDQRLSRHLSTEDPNALFLGICAPKDIEIQLFQIQEPDQLIEEILLAHLPSLS